MAKALSGGSFCVYLVHLLVLRALTRAGLSTGRFRPAVSVPFLTLLCLLGSYCIYLILKGSHGSTAGSFDLHSVC